MGEKYDVTIKKLDGCRYIHHKESLTIDELKELLGSNVIVDYNGADFHNFDEIEPKLEELQEDYVPGEFDDWWAHHSVLWWEQAPYIRMPGTWQLRFMPTTSRQVVSFKVRDIRLPYAEVDVSIYLSRVQTDPDTKPVFKKMWRIFPYIDPTTGDYMIKELEIDDADGLIQTIGQCFDNAFNEY